MTVELSIGLLFYWASNWEIRTIDKKTLHLPTHQDFCVLPLSWAKGSWKSLGRVFRLKYSLLAGHAFMFFLSSYYCSSYSWEERKGHPLGAGREGTEAASETQIYKIHELLSFPFSFFFHCILAIKDALIRRNLAVDPQCPTCWEAPETLEHLFFQISYSKRLSCIPSGFRLWSGNS